MEEKNQFFFSKLIVCICSHGGWNKNVFNSFNIYY